MQTHLCTGAQCPALAYNYYKTQINLIVLFLQDHFWTRFEIFPFTPRKSYYVSNSLFHTLLWTSGVTSLNIQPTPQNTCIHDKGALPAGYYYLTNI
jgi:hypothetical protein